MFKGITNLTLTGQLKCNQIVYRSLPHKHIILDNGRYFIPLRLLAVIQSSPIAKPIKKHNSTDEHYRIQNILHDIRRKFHISNAGKVQYPIP